LGHVERGAVGLGEAGQHEDQEADDLRDDVPDLALGAHHVDQREGAAHHDHAEQRQAHRDLVGDQLRRRAHRAEEAVFGARAPTAEEETVEGDRADGEEVEDADRDVDAVEADAVLGVAPGDDREGEDAGEDGEQWPQYEQGRDRVFRPERLLGDELADVGKRLQKAEGADPVGAVAMLAAADQFPLDHGEDRQDAEDHGEDHDRLGDHDPDRFGELRVREDEVGHAGTSAGFSISTRTWWPFRRLLALPAATPSARKQTPSGTRSRIATMASTDFEPWETRTLSSWARPRRAASSGETSTRWAGLRNFSGGFSSVIGPAQRSR